MSLHQKIKTFREKIRWLPKPLRIITGGLFALLGLLGFLPVLGFWMVPVGLAILAIDIPAAKRLVSRITTAFNKWRRSRREKK